jgi:HD-like signal output (HDOD) protein
MWREWIRCGEWENETEASIPMLPAHAMEIARLALDPEIAASRLVPIVAKDPVLATQVIRLANSAFSASAVEITGLNEAVIRVGTHAVRNVVIASCLSARVVDPQIYGKFGSALIDHSIGTAYLAWFLADRVKESPDEMFLAGLLHDIGKLLILKLAHEYGRRAQAPSEEDIAAVVQERHPHFGGWLIARWNMPRDLVNPIVWHHEPFWAERRPAAVLTYAANRLAHRYGFGCPADGFNPLEDPIFAELELDEKGLAQLDAHAPGLFEIARHIIRG